MKRETNHFEIFHHNESWMYMFDGHITKQLVSGFVSPQAAYEDAKRNPQIKGLSDAIPACVWEETLSIMREHGASLELDLPKEDFDYELAKDELIALRDLVL